MIEIAGASSALVGPGRAVAEAPRPEQAALERSCVAVLRAEWSTLALIVTEPAAPGRAVAEALAELARAYGLGEVRVVDGTGASAAEVPRLVGELAAARGGGGRAVVTVAHPGGSATGPLLASVDAVLLLVRLGASRLGTVREAMELAGRSRVLGCVVVR